MNLKIKGNKIILSEFPKSDVENAFMVLSDKVDGKIVYTSAYMLQKEYPLPEGVTKKDVKAVYLRVI